MCYGILFKQAMINLHKLILVSMKRLTEEKCGNFEYSRMLNYPWKSFQNALLLVVFYVIRNRPYCLMP